MKKLLFLLLAVVAVSCKNGSMVTPVASGKPYEMLVVIDRDDWDAPVGTTLRNVLTADIPGLPQPEAMFRLMHVGRSDFDRTFRIFRNIIVLDINPAIYTKISLKSSRDEYADGQVMMVIQAPSRGELIEYLESHPAQLTDFFTREEMQRECRSLKRTYNRRTTDTINAFFGCHILVPGALERVKVGKDFLWASTRTYDKNLVIYTFPYTGPGNFTKEHILAKRDSVMKTGIPGRSKGTWMATDTLFTDVRAINVQDAFCMESRGLWEMEHDFMGGPFVSHARVDTVNNRVVVAEGFVMEFEKKNGNLMRQMESSLYTLRLPAKKQNPEQ